MFCHTGLPKDWQAYIIRIFIGADRSLQYFSVRRHLLKWYNLLLDYIALKI